MTTYRFVGEEEKYFPSLGALLKPGDEIDLEEEPVNAELVPTSERKTRPKSDATKEGD